MRIRTLAHSLQGLAFFTLAGIAEVHLGEQAIEGKWSDIPLEIRGNSRLATDFANWPSGPEAIAKFTRKYGPLNLRRTLGTDLSGSTFEFSVKDWARLQREFQEEWRLYAHMDAADAEAIEVAPGEQLLRLRAGLAYRVGTLYRLLIFSLASLPSERVRVCARPGCSHPYFVARHLKQNFCSDGCARWGQRQWKLKWWAEHGKKWRAKRAGSLKRYRNSSRKGK